MASGVQTGRSAPDLILTSFKFQSARKAAKKEIKSFLHEAQHLTHIASGSDLDQKINSCLRLYTAYRDQKIGMKLLLATIAHASKKPEAEGVLGELNHTFQKQTQSTKTLFATFSATFQPLVKQQHLLSEALSKPGSNAAPRSVLQPWPMFTGETTHRYKQDAEPIETKAGMLNEMRQALLVISAGLQKTIEATDKLVECGSLATFMCNIEFFSVKSHTLNMFNPEAQTTFASIKHWTHDQFYAFFTTFFASRSDAQLAKYIESLKHASVWAYYPEQAFLCLQQEILVSLNKLKDFQREPTHQTACAKEIKMNLKNEIVDKILSFPPSIQDALLNSLKKHIASELNTVSRKWLETLVDTQLLYLTACVTSLQSTDAQYGEYCSCDGTTASSKLLFY